MQRRSMFPRLSYQECVRLEAKGEFPQRVYISPTIVAYYQDEIEEWINSRIRGRGRSVPRGERRPKAARKSLLGHNHGPPFEDDPEEKPPSIAQQSPASPDARE